MAMEQKVGQSQTNAQKSTTKIIQENSLTISESPVRTDQDPVPEFTEPLENDDESITEVKNREFYESFIVNPEVGLSPTKRFVYAIVRVEKGYELIDFVGKVDISGLANAVRSFPYFEQVTASKLERLLVDERTDQSFGVKRGDLGEVMVLLPSLEVMSLSSMKRGKGSSRSETSDDSWYREFRKILLEKIEELNDLKQEDFSGVGTLEEFRDRFVQLAGIKGDLKLRFFEALDKSARARRVFEEYFSFLCKMNTH